MNHAEFTTQIDRMKDVYGSKYFPPERVAVLWLEVKEKSGPVLKDVVTKLIIEQYSVPPVSKIIEAMNYFTTRIAHSKHSGNPDCEDCLGSGFITAWEREPPHCEPAFRCSCPIGRTMSKSAMEWSDAAHGLKYTRQDPRWKVIA